MSKAVFIWVDTTFDHLDWFIEEVTSVLPITVHRFRTTSDALAGTRDLLAAGALVLCVVTNLCRPESKTAGYDLVHGLRAQGVTLPRCVVLGSWAEAWKHGCFQGYASWAIRETPAVSSRHEVSGSEARKHGCFPANSYQELRDIFHDTCGVEQARSFPDFAATVAKRGFPLDAATHRELRSLYKRPRRAM